MLFLFFLCFIHPITSSQDPQTQQILSTIKHSLSTLNDMKENIKKEKETLQNEVQGLQDMKENIKKEKETLENEVKGLQDMKENIKKEKETVENEVQGLQDMKDEKIQKVCLEEHTLIRYVSNNYGQILLAIVTIILSCIVVRFIFREKISQNPKRKYETIITIRNHRDGMSLSEDEDEDESRGGLTVNNPLDRTKTMNINMNVTQKYDIENEEPEEYLDHMKEVYEIQENLGERWKEMEPGQRLNLNLWKVLSHSGTIQLTKLLMVKIERNNKYLLTFQLFNNKFNLKGFQGISHEEIDVGLINQVLNFYKKLPSFTV